MADSTGSLSPEELARLLEQLDAVMEEAAHLRSQVTRQLLEQYEHQQAVAPSRKRPRVRR